MFYLYKNGQQPISKKAWRKLEEAERAAGMGKETASVREDETQFANGASLEARVRRLENLLVALAETITLHFTEKPPP